MCDTERPAEIRFQAEMSKSAARKRSRGRAAQAESESNEVVAERRGYC